MDVAFTKPRNFDQSELVGKAHKNTVIRCMSLAELKELAAALPTDEQAELSAYLAERLRRDDPEYRKELARLIDDPEAAHWIRWDEVKKEPAA